MVKESSVGLSSFEHTYARLMSEISALKLKHNLSYSQFLKISKTEEIFVPISIFTDKLSAFETIVIYLRDNLGLRNKDIAKLTKRDERAISTTYRMGKNKYSERLVVDSFDISFPLSILKNRKMSVLENVSFYFYSKKNMTFNEISILLKKNYQTIWTVIRRYKEKDES